MKRHRYQIKGEVTPLSRDSKSFYNKNLTASPYASTPYAANQAENIKAIGREQEVERFAKDLFSKPSADKMQEYRDDPTNPLAYLPFSGEAMDAQSVGYHLDKGNYGDAAMYGAGFLLPFVPGAAVKRFAGPAIDKLKSTVKPYVDNAQGAISFHGDQIASRVNRHVLDPISETVKPYAAAYKEHKHGIRRGINELRSPNSRPFTEIFPITKAQRELVEAKQDAAWKEGIDFVDNWVYEAGRKGLPGYTGRTMRGPVARRIANIGGKPTPISLRPDLPHSNPDLPYGTDDYNPFNAVTDRLVNSRTKFLNKSNLPEADKQKIRFDRQNVGGYNSQGTGQSITLRNRGFYYKPPYEVADIGVHEKGHTFQNMAGRDTRYGWHDNTATLSRDHGGYWVPNLETELGEKMGAEMRKPVLGEYTWEASPDELHSELMSSRFRLAKEKEQLYGTPIKTSIKDLQNPTEEDLEWLLDDMDSKYRFWEEPWWQKNSENKKNILKALPSVAAVTGTGAALRSARGSEEEVYKNGGMVKYQTKGTVESRARDRFRSYLMEQEAGRDYISRKRSDTRKPGGGYYKQYEGGRYYPYKMPSEKYYTVGYGHYGPDAQKYTKGVNEAQALEFLEKDMDNAVRLAGIYVDQNTKSPYSSDPNKSFADLDPHTKYMLADYPYNLGKLSKFPKFTEAVLTGDTTAARQQYKRYDKQDRPIVKRNEAFSETFLEPWIERQRNTNQVALPYTPYPLRK